MGPRNLRRRWMRQRRKMSTKTTTTTKNALAEDRQRVQGIKDENGDGSESTTGWWIGNNNRVLIFLTFMLLTVTLSRLYIVAVSFWYFFIRSLCYLFAAWNNISTAIIRKIFLYRMYTNLAYVPPTYRIKKTLRVILINKYVRKYLARKKGNENPIWSWNDSPTRWYAHYWCSQV